jgi:hypothetical protein
MPVLAGSFEVRTPNGMKEENAQIMIFTGSKGVARTKVNDSHPCVPGGDPQYRSSLDLV